MPASMFDPATRKWWTLGAVAVGLFMIMLDNTVVNVALPTIRRELGAGLSELEWIVTGYALTFAALMLDLLHQRSRRGSRHRRELPLHRRVARRDARAARHSRAAQLRHRSVRVDVRPDRGKHLRLDRTPNSRCVRGRRRVAARLRHA